MNGFALEILKKNQNRLGSVALVDRNGTRKITWESLADRVCRVAAYARKEGLRGIVPVWMDRGMEAAATLLGLNLAGVGVAPLSITTPPSRCENISRQTGNALWTAETFETACGCAPAYELCTEGEGADPAYVVFTSGSTGTPKGVMLSNRAILAAVRRSCGPDFYDLKEGDRVLQSTSLSFIVQTTELFAPLYAGAVTCILPEEGRTDLQMIGEFVNRNGITCLFLPPQLYRRYECGPSVRCVSTGSDRIVSLGPKGCRLLGIYGMTETAACAFHYEIRRPMEQTPIGVPFEDFRAYVLDEEGREAEEGELCLSGPIADGYFGMEELTKRTFTPNPFSEDPGHRILLHTGDLVRRLPEGGYLFLNRRDNMVKINGQRVEPGEIETVMLGVPGIETAAVKGFTDEHQHSILCAYYTVSRGMNGEPEGQEEPSGRQSGKQQSEERFRERLKNHLEEKLPHYMVPQALVRLEQMPLNANGKLDRKALAMPDLSQFLGEYEAPAGEKEALLCAAFEKVLGLPRVGRDDDFFVLGGDSITALNVVSECESLGISTGDLFAGKTPKAIALLAETAGSRVYEDLPAGVKKTKLTDSQLGILLECGLEEGSTKYNIPVHLSFDREEGMDPASVKEAVDQVLRNHPALYSRITEEDGEFYLLRQAFPEAGICTAEEIRDTGAAAAGAEAGAEEAGSAGTPAETAEEEARLVEKAAREIVAPIAPGRDPFCTARALLGREKVHVLINLHHVVSDGSSVAVLVRELAGALQGKAPQPETVDAFSLYEAECRIKAGRAREEAHTYFENLLGEAETDSSLIPDHKPAEDGVPVGGCESFLLPKEGVEAFLEKTGLTENTFFMGVYGYVLAKMTGQNESIFGAAENGRGNTLLKDTVSMLVKTLPVVMKIDEEKTGRELLEGLQAQFFASMRNDCIGFNELAKEFGVRSDVMFVYQGEMFNGLPAAAAGSPAAAGRTAAADGKAGAAGAAAGPAAAGSEETSRRAGTGIGTGIALEILETGESLSNVSLNVLKRPEGYELRVEYRSDLYEKYTIERFAGLYRRAVTAFLNGTALKETELIGAADLAFLDAENASNCRPLKEETILDIFRETAGRHPQKPAIIAGGRSYTYAQVDEISDRIAAYLSGQGIARGSVVSVLIPRNEYMLIASMGVMKAGAAYQPLDPSYPEERLQFMTTDAKAALLIKDRKLDHILKGYEGKVLYTDEIPELPAGTVPSVKPAPEDLYILLYTSGTTGTPKGVMLAHGNLNAFVHAHVRVLGLEEDSVLAQYASYGFDAHMADLYPAVLMGCTVTVIPEELRLDLAGIKEFCETSGVTHLLMTTQVARQFAIACPKVKGLKVLDTGGEKLVSYHPEHEYRVLNLYGPTEGTVLSTGFEVDRYYDNIPIGKAIPNYRLYVADPCGRRVPVGVPGELIQCGPQVGLGYLGRPELTEKVFVRNPFEAAGPGYERCYKTGDIVRFLHDGNIEYIGRRDHQVKIRGFRIELGEVEKALMDAPGIKAAVVTVIDKESGKSLCAYVVSEEKKIDAAALQSFVGKSHPAYMIPAVIMQLDRIPLNANGKVDKRKLPKPELHFEDVKKPENELQQQIADCVKEAVGTEDFGIDTDLFMAGLTSIGSIRLCTLLSDQFDLPVRIRDLKRAQTVKGLEQWIRAAKGLAEEPGERKADASEAAKTAAAAKAGEAAQDAARAEVLPSAAEAPAAEAPAAAAGKEAPAAQAVPEASVLPAVYGAAHPITKTMEGIFTECFGKPDSTAYNIPCLLKLGEGIDEEKLKDAIVRAVEAHPCMKAELFTDTDGKVRQHRRDRDAYTAAEIRELTLESQSELTDRLVTPFPLTGSRLFEISLLHAEGLYLFINIHHIISDGTSMTVLLRDIEKAYAGEPLQAETYSSFDVAEEEQRSRTKAELAAEEEYYDRLLEGTDKDFLLLPDQPEEGAPASGRLLLSQTEADAGVIRSFCEQHRLSMNAYFVSVFGTVLAAYAGTEYSVFNTVYNGRNDSRTAETVAMLVKTLPVVCHTENRTAAGLVKEMAEQLMDSMSNDLYSYAEISRRFGVKNEVMFIFQGDGFERKSFCGVKAEERPLGLSDAKMAMSLQVMLRDGKLCYDFEYDPKRFTEGLARAFVLAFDQAAADFAKKEKLSEVSLLSAREEAQMERYNATELAYDRSRTIADFFLEKVREQPEALCVEYDGRRYSFGEIGALTAKLSCFLMEEGLGRGDIAAILIRRDENMVIGAHGVIRTGAAYLGLDPTYPPERLAFMLKDCGAAYLIADRSLMGLLPEYQGRVIYTDEIAGLRMPSEEELAAFAKQEKHCISPEDPALIIYSSGTTGLPKGSVLRHRNIVCFYQNYTRDSEIRPGAHVATYASFGFDGGAQDVFCCPMAGASLYVIPDEIRLDLSRLEQFYVKNGITSGFMTTQVGCMFIANTKCRTLRCFSVGGEKLVPVKGPEWVRFRNGYGPSETMCYVNLYPVTNTGKLQPIGRVSRNTKEYIIDKYGKRLPFGACGELCIAGGQVGMGYLGRPEKTAQVFVKNPFCEDPEYAVMYRTGDIVRQLPDGNYDFVGRRDGQVKIRGFRIELGEIEQQIRKFPGITGTVVRACDNPSGGKYLAAYVVMDETLDPEELKAFIGKEKPDYMIPAVILQIDRIPLTSNGKVDAAKLPKPELGAFKKGAEPAGETEEKLCGIFGDVLGIEKVYADDDFFKIGGSSISAIQVVVRCEQAGFPVVYKNLFANPTPQKLAAFFAGGKVKDRSAAEFGKNNEYDYSALQYNVIENLPGIRNEGVGDVLLTGVTGFLGSHVYRELMESTSGRVICLVRSKNGLPADLRFETMMTWYFEDWFREEMRQRTVILDGGLEDEGIRETLKAQHFDTIINCAANVKHFAVENELMSSNFSGVENLIEVAEETGARLIQISSMSVSGESVNGSVPKDYIFRETDLNIGQSLENQYIYTKYLGEQAVIDAVSRKRIRGKVIRLGNLMARIDDSQFQVNAGQNGMLRLYLGFAKLGCYPVNMLDAELEFSPIDSVAKAVVLLSGTQDEYTMFHAKNCNAIHYGYLLHAISEAGYPIEVVEDSVFEERLKKALEDPDRAEGLGGLLAYRNSSGETLVRGAEHSGDDSLEAASESRLKIGTSTTFTTKALYRLGFGWPLISMEYLREMVRVLVELDFFEA